MTVHHVFAIAGAKGGVGKTTTAINIGAAFAEQGASVVVVETDLAMANVVDFLDLGLDIETDPTLHDVLAGRSRLSAAVYQTAAGVDVIPSGVALDGYVAASPELIGEVVSQLRKRYHVVILDTPAGVSRETLLPLQHADDTVLVSTPRVASVRDAEKTKQLAERVGGRVAGIVFTMTGPGRAPDADRIAQYVGVPLLGHVPEDEAVPESQDLSVPVLTYRPDSPAAAAYRSVAEELARHMVAHQADEPAPEPAGTDDRPSPDDRSGTSRPGTPEPPVRGAGDDAAGRTDPAGPSRPMDRPAGDGTRRRDADRTPPDIRPPAATDGSGLTADADGPVDGGPPGEEGTTEGRGHPSPAAAGGPSEDRPATADGSTGDGQGASGSGGPGEADGTDPSRPAERSLRRRLADLLARARAGPAG